MSKREKFVDLAEKRVNRAIKDISLIGNLANRNNYSYEDSDIKKIISALEAEVKSLKTKFEQSPSKDKITFSLSEK